MNLVHYGLYNKYFYFLAKITRNLANHIRLFFFDFTPISTPPLVSVVIPFYNEEKHFIACIESVLSQTYSNIECLVIDDASTSTSQLKAIKKKYTDKIKFFSHPYNKGLSAARNTGIKNAEGSYITFLDADDILLKSSISRRVIDLMNNSDPLVIGSFGFSAHVKENFSPLAYLLNYYGIKRQVKSLENCKLYVPFPVHSPLLDKKIFSTFSFDESLIFGAEDWHFWNELLINDYKFISSGYVSGLYRQKKSSMLRSNSEERFKIALTLIQSAYNRGRELNFSHFNEKLLNRAQLERLIFNYCFSFLKGNQKSAQNLLNSFKGNFKLKKTMREKKVLYLIGLAVCRFKVSSYSKTDKDLQRLIHTIYSALQNRFN